MGTFAYNRPYKAIADETPKACKDVAAVIAATLTEIGIACRGVQLTPLAVIKGD